MKCILGDFEEDDRMQLQELAMNPKLFVGIKQTKKIMNKDCAKVVYIAKDTDHCLQDEIVSLANAKHVEVIWVESKSELGRACNIDVGAATAVIEK